jgi:ABC-type cobalt transport system substrate-binding protein
MKTIKSRLPLVLVLVIALVVVSLLQAQQDSQSSPSDKSQEQVLQELLKDPTPKPVTQPIQGSDEVTIPSVQSVDPKAKAPLIIREGDWVINRLGRFHRQPKGSPLFVYEADGSALSEPPLILLPSRKLELMEQLAKQKPDAKFVIIGEITVYHGKGYLLLRKVMLHRDMGQF